MKQHKVFVVKCSKCEQPIQPLVPVLIEVGEATAVSQVYALEWCTSCRAQYVAESADRALRRAYDLKTCQEHDDFMSHLLCLYPQHKEQIVAHWLPADCFEA